MRPVTRTGLRPNRARRGAALLASVILSLVAVSLAMVLVGQILDATATSTQNADDGVAQRMAEDVTAQFTTALADDPTFYTRQLFHAERPRVCAPTGAPIDAEPDPSQPPASWPASCGPVWEYLPVGQTTAVYDPATALVRAEVYPPTVDDPTLRLVVLATIGQAEYAQESRWLIPSATQVHVYSAEELHLDTLAGATGTVAVNGTIYSPVGGSTPIRPEHTVGGVEPLTGARLLSECGFTGPLAGAEGNWESLPVTDRGATGCMTAATSTLDVRDLATVPLLADNARRSALPTADGCPTDTPPLVTTGGTARPAWLCLHHGHHLTTTDDTPVVVTTDGDNAPAAYHLMFVTTPHGPAVHVRVAEATVDDTATTYADASVSYAAGTHPLAPNGATWNDLGTFNLPATGAIRTDATTYVGACPAAVGGTGCDPTGPGVPVTVIAGTTHTPQDLIVAGPITRTPNAPVGLVAAGTVDVPFYTHLPGGDLTLGAHLFGLDDLTTRPDVGTPGGTLTVHGSIGAPHLDQLAGWDRVEVHQQDGHLLPTYVTFTPTWRHLSTTALAGASLCGETTCAELW